jgi:hypothetical protein
MYVAEPGAGAALPDRDWLIAPGLLALASCGVRGVCGGSFRTGLRDAHPALSLAGSTFW